MKAEKYYTTEGFLHKSFYDPTDKICKKNHFYSVEIHDSYSHCQYYAHIDYLTKDMFYKHLRKRCKIEYYKVYSEDPYYQLIISIRLI